MKRGREPPEKKKRHPKIKSKPVGRRKDSIFVRTRVEVTAGQH